MDNLTPEALKALSEAATPGEWTLGRIVDAPGGGRFRYVDAGGHYQAARFVWEMQTGEGDAQKAQTKLAVALVNAYRAGLLVHVDAKGGGDE